MVILQNSSIQHLKEKWPEQNTLQEKEQMEQLVGQPKL